ncbi:hypothetical protein MMC06_000231 [Schaereria dolodes]|nr:hypothetical protein [Schaereria dolodes]
MPSPSPHAHYHVSSPSWAPLSLSPSLPSPSTPFTGPISLQTERLQEAASEAAWASAHSPSSYGYTASSTPIPTRDGATISAKIYLPALTHEEKLVDGEEEHDDDDATNERKQKQKQNQKQKQKLLPILFVTHMGGWIEGSPISEEIVFLRAALQRCPRMLVVSVNFRLAPEHPFPTPLHDCWDALQWTLGAAASLGGDTGRLVLAGSSAGGNLAAVLALMCRDEGVGLKGCLLNVPVTCHPRWVPGQGGEEFGSYGECVGGLLSGEEMRQVWDLYIPNPDAGKDWKASPLLADLAGLPPTYIFIAGQDPLRDEGIAYAEALERTGVPTRTRIYQGVPHTFAKFPQLEETKRFNADIVEGMKLILAED